MDPTARARQIREEWIPEALRETPEALTLTQALTQSVDELDAAVHGIAISLESAERLVIAATAYRDALAQIEAWGDEVRQAVQEAREAAQH